MAEKLTALSEPMTIVAPPNIARYLEAQIETAPQVLPSTKITHVAQMSLDYKG